MTLNDYWLKYRFTSLPFKIRFKLSPHKISIVNRIIINSMNNFYFNCDNDYSSNYGQLEVIDDDVDSWSIEKIS
jgi:hypothetical protein